MIVLYILFGAFIFLMAAVLWQREPKEINDANPYLHPEKKDVLPKDMREFITDMQKSQHKQGVYEKYIKRSADIVLSFCGLVLLSPLYLVLALAVIIDDPGPAFFTQKRIGKDRAYFFLHKFRTMKMSTPHDMPTHMLANPDQYITRIGKLMRRSSLDELPQIWDIFRGKMSIIGPRPALWNQADLIFEREKYKANDITPGLTGWAQINGRDELEISAKARLDGEYVRRISFLFDCRCFIGTVFSVIRRDGVVEGGTGMLGQADLMSGANGKSETADEQIQKRELKK